MSKEEEDVGVLEALLLGKEYSHEDATGFWSDWGAKGINWCEEDYVHTEFVAELWNTLSNLAFVAAGVAGWRMTTQLKLPRRFYGLSLAIIGLGITSGAFHGTLLWINQKLDETFENASLVYLFHSDKASDVIPLVHSLIVLAGAFTITFFLFCELHLIGSVLVTLVKVRQWSQLADKVTDGKAGLNGAVRTCAVSVAMGAICWLIDRLACKQVSQLAFNPQLHAWWHILCGISLYEGFVLAAALHNFQQALELPSFDVKSLPLPLIKSTNYGFHYPETIKLKT
mmetsp:Transcript_20823/g.38753  ORF Transcript_20823/g.38753 Transcript_20823/m.38753 type:complete len:284 (+) Transcript_20823:1-852(+)